MGCVEGLWFPSAAHYEYFDDKGKRKINRKEGGCGMMIFAQIPTGKRIGDGWYQETTDLMEVHVIEIMRYRCDRSRERYYYEAKINAPAVILSDAIGLKDGAYRVNVSRSLNPKWKPPVFPAGVNRVDV